MTLTALRDRLAALSLVDTAKTTAMAPPSVLEAAIRMARQDRLVERSLADTAETATAPPSALAVPRDR
jgi:hypothetical protein